MMLGRYKPGDVVQVRCLIGDGEAVYRPAVVLTKPEYHREFGEIVVMPLVNYEDRREDWRVRLQDWQMTGLGRPAWVLKLLKAVDGGAIRGKAGELSSRDWEELEFALLRLVTEDDEEQSSQRPAEKASPSGSSKLDGKNDVGWAYS